MESSDWEYSARGIERLADVFICLLCYIKMNAGWRISSSFQWWIVFRHWTVWQRQNKRLAGWLVPPNLHNLYKNIEPHTFNLYWFLFHLLRLCFQHKIKEPFHTDQYERWRVWKTGATSPVLQWFGIKWHTHGFQPPHGLLGQIYAPCCGFIQDMCVCAMRKVQWAHDGNMQAFVGIFLFFPGAALLFF